MAWLYVARSTSLGKWGADVGVSKHLFKIGVTDQDPKALLADGLAGERDWTVVKKEAVDGLDEAQVIERLQAKEKMIDPTLYPRIKGVVGIFRVKPANVENHMLVKRALAGEQSLAEVKLKPADFAAYLIANATPRRSEPEGDA